MKRALAIAGLAVALAAANVRTYTDVADPSIANEVRHGVVLIIPSVDRCYGVEAYGPAGTLIHGIEPFGGECM